MRLTPRTPPQIFTLVSLLLVAVMVGATGLALSTFFRQAILAREGTIIADFARAVAAADLKPGDFAAFREPEVQARLQRSFAAVTAVSEVARVKVFNRAGEIVWADDPELIGTWALRREDVERAAGGGRAVIFYEEEHVGERGGRGDLPATPLVEFYVPIVTEAQTAGVMALYRSAAPLNATIERGVVLVWAATGLGGAVLYLALFQLFRSVYRRQREAESRLSRLSSEHERIVQLEKLSAVGRMIGEIAHQINNPLVGVLNLAQLAERESANPARVRELLGSIRQAGVHCRDFVQRMLEFTRLSRLERQPADMAALIDDTVTLFRQSAGATARIVVEAPSPPPRLDVDPTLLRHALFNLIANAERAGAATVTIRLSPEAGPDGAPGWSLSVLDDGPGLPAEVLDKVFQPFFTTRPQGIGLGLSVVEHIAVLHGGRASAANRPEGGAHFALWLPAPAQGETREP